MAKKKTTKNNAGGGSIGKAKTLNNSIPPTPSAESGPPSPGGANAQANGKNKNKNKNNSGAGGRNGTANDSSISIPLTPSSSNEVVQVSPVATNATTTNQRASSQEPQSGFVSPPFFQTPPTSPSSPAIDARLLEDLLLPDPIVPLTTQEQATEAEIQHTPVAEVVSGDENDTSDPQLHANSETPLPAADAVQEAQTPTPKTETGPEQDLVPIQNVSEEQQPIVNDSLADKEDKKIDPPLEAETETDESGANTILAVDHGVGSGQDEGVPQDAQPTASHPSPGTDELPVVGPQGFYIDLTTPTGELSSLEYEEDGKIDLGLETENQGDASGGDKTQVDEHVAGATGDGGVFQTTELASEAEEDALPPADSQVEESDPGPKLTAPTDPAGITDTITVTQVEPKTIVEDLSMASDTQSPAAEDNSETTPTVVVTLATPTQEGTEPDVALLVAPTPPADSRPLVQDPEVVAKADPPSSVSNIQDDFSGIEEGDAEASSSAEPIPPADSQTPVREPEPEPDSSAIVSSAQADPSVADVVGQDDLPPSPPQTDIGVEDIVTQVQDLETSADRVQPDIPQSRESEARAEESKTPVQATQIPTPEASPDTERAEGRVEVDLKAESPLLDGVTTTDSASGEGALSEDESTHASVEHPATTEATSEAETMPEAPEEDTEEEVDLSEETSAAQACSPTSTPVKPTEIQTPPSPASTAPPSSQPSPPTAVAPLPPISAQDIASGNQDIIAIANLFATMKKTVVSMKTAFDRIGTQAERMVSYSQDVHTAEQLKKLRSALQVQIERQNAEIADLRMTLEVKIKAAVEEKLRSQLREMVKETLQETIREKVQAELQQQIPEDFRQQVISHQRQILEVKTTLHNSEARRYNALQTMSTARLRPLLRPLPTPEQSPVAPPITRSSSMGTSTLATPASAYPGVPAPTPIKRSTSGSFRIDRGPLTASTLFPEDLRSLFRLGPDETRKLLRDYGLVSAAPTPVVERPPPRDRALPSVDEEFNSGSDSENCSGDEGSEVHAADMNKFMAHIGVPFLMIPTPKEKVDMTPPMSSKTRRKTMLTPLIIK